VRRVGRRCGCGRHQDTLAHAQQKCGTGTVVADQTRSGEWKQWRTRRSCVSKSEALQQQQQHTQSAASPRSPASSACCVLACAMAALGVLRVPRECAWLQPALVL
jgi:hypothetical protein